MFFGSSKVDYWSYEQHHIIQVLHDHKDHSSQSPFSHLLITHSYLCSVLFTRSSKQVLMKTKGIRQAEDESPYTVKTIGATWWKEEAFSCFQQPGPWTESPGICRLAFKAGSHPTSFRQLRAAEQHPPPSIQLRSQLKTGPLWFFFFFKRLIRSEKQIIDHCRRSSKGALTHVGFL